MLLGKVTDTQDITGTVLREAPVAVTEDEVREAVMGFVGDYMQIPPMYSALKVNGKKLCDLARQGVTVERAPRPVQILSTEILSVDLPRVHMRVECSKGTYIRTLCQDIGEKLGCGACMESLLRTRVSEFALQDALRLSEIEELVKKESEEAYSFVRPVDSVFLQYKRAVIRKEFNKLLYNGNRMAKSMFVAYDSEWEQEQIRVYDEEGRFIGIYRFDPERGDFKPVKLFME